jgi:hypothetical protein
MSKKLIILTVLLTVSNLFSQKKITAITSPVETLACKCSNLEIYPYFYYEDQQNGSNSSLHLRFDFHHKGKIKCKPEFVGNITIYRADDITVTIPLNALTSYVNTENQRIFVITQLSLPNSFRPMTIGGNYKITYSLKYGNTTCPATSTKTVRFAKSEPIL